MSTPRIVRGSGEEVNVDLLGAADDGRLYTIVAEAVNSFAPFLSLLQGDILLPEETLVRDIAGGIDVLAIIADAQAHDSFVEGRALANAMSLLATELRPKCDATPVGCFRLRCELTLTQRRLSRLIFQKWKTNTPTQLEQLTQKCRRQRTQLEQLMTETPLLVNQFHELGSRLHRTARQLIDFDNPNDEAETLRRDTMLRHFFALLCTETPCLRWDLLDLTRMDEVGFKLFIKQFDHCWDDCFYARILAGLDMLQYDMLDELDLLQYQYDMLNQKEEYQPRMNHARRRLRGNAVAKVARLRRSGKTRLRGGRHKGGEQADLTIEV